MPTPDVSVLSYFKEFFLVEKWMSKLFIFFILLFLAILLGRLPRFEKLKVWVNAHARSLLCAALVLGLTLRIVWYLWLPHIAGTEGFTMLQIAKNIASGHGFIANGKPTIYRSFGYCYFMAALFYLYPSVALIHIVNALLSTSTGLMLYLLGKEISGRFAGLAACFLWILYPTSIFSSNLILDEHLCIPLMLSGLFFIARYLRKPQLRYLIYSGLGLGLGALARPIPSTFPVAIFFTFWISRYSFWGSVKRALLVALLILACATPWAMRNWVQMGSPVLYCVSQYGFYWANNPTYDVRFPVNPTPQNGEDPEITRLRGEFDLHGGAAEVHYSKAASRKAWEWIRNNPSTFIKKTAGKAFHLLGFSQEEWAIAMNIDSTEQDRKVSTSSWKYRLLIKSQNWNYIFVFLSALGALVCFVYQWFRGQKNPTLLLLILAAAQIFTLTIVYLAHLKYRFMLDPFFLLGCAYFFSILLKTKDS